MKEPAPAALNTRYSVARFQPVKPWPVERMWTVFSKDGSRHRVPTRALSKFRACCMPGTAGLGKTYELSHLAEFEGNAGREVLIARLATLAQTGDGLVAKLNAISAGMTDESTIFLDVLDEVMIPVRQGGLILSSWIRDAIVGSKVRLRVSCRSAVWQKDVHAAMVDAVGAEESATAILEPLSDDDIKAVAANSAASQWRSWTPCKRQACGCLQASHSRLKCCFASKRRAGMVPENRMELFREGIDLLADEQEERREEGTVPERSPR